MGKEKSKSQVQRSPDGKTEPGPYTALVVTR